MRALCWHGKYSVSVDTVPDPEILEPSDAIKVTSTAICSSDLHLFDRYQPTMEDGDIQAIFCCRKGGTVSVPGVDVGMIDKMPFGAAMKQRAGDQGRPDARAALFPTIAG